MLFLPELTLLFAGLLFFIVSLGKPDNTTVRNLSIGMGILILLSTLISLKQDGSLFYESYRVDLFSQVFKLLIATATLVVLGFSDLAPGIKKDVKSEYYMFLFIGVLGLMMLVSSVELLAIFIALELSSFAVYIMVPMRSPVGDVVYQMESGIKYLLFGVMTTGFMLFGMSYIY
ncbi:MAG: NADH-quinone oxidoreductase subunit N, partial [Desulfobacterales bacterium]|nr:NADH-quinone oxidoreductase subunit N [Desulfobacterales bacterium]